jgi:MFS family permease
MFGPGLFTGALIARFGALRIILAGVALNIACIAVAMSGLDFMNFAAALVLLGLGWNFMYVGGTTLLTQSYRPAEKAKAQAANDFTVFTVVSIASVSSGALFFNFGWGTLLLIALPIVAAVGLSVLWFMFSRHQPRMA